MFTYFNNGEDSGDEEEELSTNVPNIDSMHEHFIDITLEYLHEYVEDLDDICDIELIDERFKKSKKHMKLSVDEKRFKYFRRLINDTLFYFSNPVSDETDDDEENFIKSFKYFNPDTGKWKYWTSNDYKQELCDKYIKKYIEKIE
jgi:hypothetical protein